jgi:uncharacterized protein (DUF58 family)
MAEQPASAPTRNVEAILQKVEWTVLRRLDGLLHGDYRTLFRGFGIDLSDVREYQYSDDVRHIDWNVTARMQIPHVRQYVEDRELTAWFVVDMTGSMQFGSHQLRKSEVLLEQVALLARLLTKHGNRIGLILYRGQSATDAPDIQVVPAGLGRLQVLRLLQTIAKPPQSKLGPTQLHACFSQCASIIKRRSLVFVASDFVSPGKWWQPLGQMAMRNEVIALHIRDALEAKLPNLGLVTFADLESQEQITIDTSSKAFRTRFASLALQRQEQTQAQLARANIDYLQATDAQALVNFAVARKRRRHVHTLRTETMDQLI